LILRHFPTLLLLQTLIVSSACTKTVPKRVH
jgi:hypothetical protein